jgi:hypothetical protein
MSDNKTSALVDQLWGMSRWPQKMDSQPYEFRETCALAAETIKRLEGERAVYREALGKILNVVTTGDSVLPFSDIRRICEDAGVKG